MIAEVPGHTSRIQRVKRGCNSVGPCKNIVSIVGFIVRQDGNSRNVAVSRLESSKFCPYN